MPLPRSRQARHDERQVVFELAFAHEVLDSLHYCLVNFCRRPVAMGHKNAPKPFFSELDPIRAGCFCHPVREEGEQIARSDSQTRLLVICLR